MKPSEAVVGYWFGSPAYLAFTGGRPHYGVDITYSHGGSGPLYALEDGEVTMLVEGCTVGDSSCGGGWGNHLVIKYPKVKYNGNVLYSNYAHIESSKVKVGDKVKLGQEVATMGTTGISTGIHLHFEIWSDPSGAKEGRLDPILFIDFSGMQQLFPYDGPNPDKSKWCKPTDTSDFQGSDDGGDSKSDDSSSGSSSGNQSGTPGGYFIPKFDWDEDMIPNMPKDRDYLDSDYSVVFDKLGEVNLTSSERESIAKWKEELDEELPLVIIARRAFALVGILCIVGAVILLTSYVFDMWNITGFSLISFLTLGRVKVSDGNEDYKVGKRIEKNEGWDSEYKVSYRVASFKTVFIISVTLTLIGVLMLNGWVFILIDFVKNVWDWIRMEILK